MMQKMNIKKHEIFIVYFILALNTLILYLYAMKFENEMDVGGAIG